MFTEDEISQLKCEKLKTASGLVLFCINKQFKSKLLFQKDILYSDGGVGLPPYRVYTICEEFFIDEITKNQLFDLFEFYRNF